MRSLIRSVLGFLLAVLSWWVQHLPQSLGSHASGTGVGRGDPEGSRTLTPGWKIIHRLFFFTKNTYHLTAPGQSCWDTQDIQLLGQVVMKEPQHSSIWKHVIRIGTIAGEMQWSILNYFCNRSSVFKREKNTTHNVSYFNFKRERLDL